MTLTKTGRVLIGYDYEKGEVIRKPLLIDERGVHYVMLDRGKHMRRDVFTEQVIGEGMIEREF